MRYRASQGGFTLIEIMVVVVIIGLLVAIVAPNVLPNLDKAQITRVKSDIQAIDSALAMYRLDNYRYPSTQQGLEALVSRPADPSLVNWQEGGYLSKMPKDPWGAHYQYQSPGQHGEADIYTLGADGQIGGEGINADRGNWNIDN